MLAVSESSSSSNGKFHTMQVIMMMGYTIMCILSLTLIAYLRYNRSVALKGNSTAARKIILPAFEPLLWILGAATGVFALYLIIALAFDLYPESMPTLASEFFYCGRQFVLLLVIVFMFQKSVSIPALRRTVFIALLLALYTVPFDFYSAYWGSPAHTNTYMIVQKALRALLLLFYVYILVWPPSRASKRTLREFCIFTLVYHALSMTSTELLRFGSRDTGYMLLNVTILWASLCPLVIWRVLRADTEHWRGMGQRACALQTVLRNKGQINEHISSEGLHVLIEMHRKLVIDFAYLDIRQRIGVGASAIVFNGILNSRTPIATKVYTPSTLTDEVVASFSQEAALCGALRHPNITKFYGMCICPPTICLVFELCQGNLDDLLRSNLRRDFHPNRQQLGINLGYMIDAARAVAYLHSFSPGLLHRDIKPTNFLVDRDCNVKLTDFGESRSLPSASSGDGKSDILSISMPSPSILQIRADKMTVKGTVDYMAPELINGKGGFANYGEAADIFSLAMTMWDILHPGVDKYPGCSKSHLHIFEAVLDGKRPELAADLHPTLRELIQSAWHEDPRMRPSAQVLVIMLESIQEEVCAAHLADLMSELTAEASQVDLTASRGCCIAAFTGESAVELLLSCEHVYSAGEAIRLGNMWMDAGLLHHIRHSQSFQNDDSLYYLDEEQIQNSQPLDSASPQDFLNRYTRQSAKTRKESTASSTRSSGTNAATTATEGPEHVKFCTCRSYGQRLESDGAKPIRKRDQLRRKKYQPIVEENVLTMSLLVQDEAALPDFEGFESSRSSFNFNFHDMSTSSNP
ncbi:hypothetical protein Poli38472_004030 [Pythium oligandrum]|uniref:Protein kinase domain-containing protein n=1 Tax=Pythium oligandrum TaxID=41045 RepID=A0A8K1CMX6_PYTOL|nr:hypothetical protein Poli38472_004030 [Pythium oligandrum]|eukprot:TMW66265.1 hypothetical protein Poli38472_004030 [Pythium oligandrum]